MNWVDDTPALAALDSATRQRLDVLDPMALPSGRTLFQPGDTVRGYVVVLSGQIDVTLTGATGREILLYSVVPGQSCIQSTLGLLGEADYSAEARTADTTRLVLLPRALFLELLSTSDTFRKLVFNAFSDRMQLMMKLLEKVAFTRAEHRLAERLLRLCASTDKVTITQSELAGQIGTAREVVSRRLESWGRRGWVETGRGWIRVLDPAALTELARAEN